MYHGLKISKSVLYKSAFLVVMMKNCVSIETMNDNSRRRGLGDCDDGTELGKSGRGYRTSCTTDWKPELPPL